LAKPGLKNFVDGDPESISLLRRCEQRTILDSNNFQFLHVESPLAITRAIKTAM